MTGTPNGTPSKPTKTKNVNVTPNGKRKRDITANEDDEEVGIFNDNEDVDIKVKLEPQSRRKSVVKTEETLADGTIDLAQDSYVLIGLSRIKFPRNNLADPDIVCMTELE